MGQEVLSELQSNGRWHNEDSVGKELAIVPSDGPILASSSGSKDPGGISTTMRGSLGGLDLTKDQDTLLGSANGAANSGPKGLTGLQNLGNTCFMNSALQCLVHTPELVEFFLQDYSKEINRGNPLGMQGELALAFGELLRKLWAPGRTPVAPRAFKSKLSSFAPQFGGYNQHDSQELLAFLLDGLHEDLNRVKTKPYIEVKDADGRPDEEVANEYWGNHRARNDSIIVDLFQGQYKSTLVCPKCSKVSVTFDPFMYLSLPLPAKVTRSITVTVLSGNGTAAPMFCTVTVQKDGRCKDLLNALNIACSLQDDERLLLVELYNHRIFRILDEPQAALKSIQNEDRLAAYRLPKTSRVMPLLVFLNQRQEESSGAENSRKMNLFGAPLITIVPEEGLSRMDVFSVVDKLVTPMKRCSLEDPRSEQGPIEAVGSLKAKDIDNPNLLIPTCEEVNGSLLQEPSSCPASQNSALPYRVFLSDEKGAREHDLNEYDSPDPLFTSISVSKFYITIEWSHAALQEQFDLKILDTLPEVCKNEASISHSKAKEAVSLYACLEAFLKEEPLGPDDMWYCPNCKEHRQASKKLDLWRLPDILVVHLKRFSYSRYNKTKLDSFVNFPLHDLDLTNYVSHMDRRGSYVYELFAVSNHYGSLGGGHYTAYAKLTDEDKWYNFDDSHVSPVNEDQLRTSAAYVLFYRRKHTEQPLENSFLANHMNGSLKNGRLQNIGQSNVVQTSGVSV